MKFDERDVETILDRTIARHGELSRTDVDSAMERAWKSLQPETAGLRDWAIVSGASRKISPPFRLAIAATAVLAIVIVSLSAIAVRSLVRPDIYATVETSRDAGRRIRTGEVMRSSGEGTMLALADGSRVEMRAQSELLLERADDGVRIRLNTGSVIVNAAKQGKRHLYVRTKDVDVSVTGTVFLVNAEETGSRVAVIQGEVHVQQGATLEKLLPGEQVATNPMMEWQPVSAETSWSRNAPAHLALLQQSRQQESDGPVLGQVPTRRPTFEIVSIRVSKTTDGSDSDGGPGYLRASGSLRSLIRMAYGVRPDQVEGEQKWLDQDRYDIEARADGPAKRPELLEMLQTLLAERFKLELHRETKFFSGYALIAGKNGLNVKVKEVRPGDSSDSSWHDQSGVVTAEKMTMTGLAKILSSKLRIPVSDETGISGAFDFKLEYEPGDVNTGAGTGRGPLFTALQEQLGLRLDLRKVQSEVIVVDTADKPSPN